MTSSSSTLLSTFVPPLMKDEEPNWAELPSELTSSILLRLSVTEILDNDQKVSRPWRRVCKDPSMWRKINMRNLGNHGMLDFDSMCRHAVDRNQGGLVEIHIGNFVNNDILDYIADRSRNLRSLGLGMCYPRTTKKGLVNAIAKLPLLETLEVSHSCLKLNLKAIGHACPQLKTLKLNSSGSSYMPSRTKCNDDGYALAIAESMPELRHLQLLGNRLTDTGLNAIILDGCPHLEHLDLRKCFNINLVGDLEKRCFERIITFVNSDFDDLDNIYGGDDIEVYSGPVLHI